MLIPGQPIPSLSVDTLAHGRFELPQAHGENGTLLIFYRGLHCPICIRQMSEFEEKQARLAELGVTSLMVSADGVDKAKDIAQKANVDTARIGYGLSLIQARDAWGLPISSARTGSTEPDFFSEPGHFYVAPDNTLYFGWVQTSPFARPALDDIIGAIAFRLDKNYPPRGMYTGALPGDA